MSVLYTNITLGYYKQNCHIQIVMLWSKAYVVSFLNLLMKSLFFSSQNAVLFLQENNLK